MIQWLSWWGLALRLLAELSRSAVQSSCLLVCSASSI